ncbi:MAG: alpha-L-fucosidase [Reichenbachiella sp.]
MKKINLLLLIVCLIQACNTKTNVQKESAVEVLTKDQRMEWWRESKFGMFIHWGVYAVPAGIHEGKETNIIAEWIMDTQEISVSRYEEYAKEFNPTLYDADAWMKLAKEAGVKYIVITSKHHDGFSLWDSKVSDYDVMDFTPYKKDILKELAKACKKYDIKFGLYHSIMDWHHPQAQAINEPNYNDKNAKINPEFPKYIESYLKPQLKELIENYDPAILWFDGEWIKDYTHEQALDLYDFVMDLKPDIIINNRIDKGRQGMQGMNAEGEFVGDFGTPEQEILAGASDVDWESCMTMNDTWGFDQTDENWKSTEALIYQLIDVASKGGNYLLNIGPKASGEIPEASIICLQQIGEWMQVNSEAIYGTEKLNTVFGEGDTIRYTKKKGTNTYYAIKLKSLSDQLTIRYLKPSESTQISLLGYNEQLEYRYDDENGLIISLPENIDQTLWKDSKAWTFRIENSKERIN